MRLALTAINSTFKFQQSNKTSGGRWKLKKVRFKFSQVSSCKIENGRIGLSDLIWKTCHPQSIITHPTVQTSCHMSHVQGKEPNPTERFRGKHMHTHTLRTSNLTWNSGTESIDLPSRMWSNGIPLASWVWCRRWMPQRAHKRERERGRERESERERRGRERESQREREGERERERKENSHYHIHITTLAVWKNIPQNISKTQNNKT